MIIIGERLKKARVEKHLSQKVLGELLNISKVSICGYEKGNRTPTLETFINILNILNLDPNYLLGLDVSVVAETEESFTVKLAKEDLNIISELKKNPSLYAKLYSDSKRTIELIVRRLK